MKGLLPQSLLGAILLFACPAHSIWPFPPKRFRGNSLISASSMGLDDNGRVVAFGDFNGDQFLDVLSVSADQRTLSVYLWDHDKFQYVNSTSFSHPRRVVNVVPGDFTHSGRLDLLVMSQGGSGDQLDLVVYPASPAGGFKVTNPLSVPSAIASQPIPLDASGNMKIDLLGMPERRGSLKLWENVWNASDPRSSLFNLIDPKFEGKQCALANPHSNAVVDLNGDCLADLFLVCDEGRGAKSFQIWVNNKSKGFTLAQQGRLPTGTQSISFVDIDRDGTIDMVFPTCNTVSTSTGYGNDCSINIAYNKQLPLCSSTAVTGIKNGRRTCRLPEDLCVADPDFQFDLTERPDNDAFARIPLSSFLTSPGSPSPNLLVLDTTHEPSLPLPLKLGDANLDGFPDLLMIIDRTPRLLFSVPCEKGVIGCDSEGKGRRGWHVARKGAEALATVGDARGVAFLDMDEDGTLDIMIQRTGDDGQGTVLFVQNNFYFDAFFLKAIVLNSACGNGLCPGTNETGPYHPFGVSYPGATYKYTVLDTSGRRSAAQVGQLAQTSYHSLLTPYSFFGLGRTNNYIENLFVGSTIHGGTDDHYIAMEGVIPNSKVVVTPPSELGDAWKRELFLRPGEWIPWVTVTVVVGTALLAIIVFVLHLSEKREDELERRKISHHINFDAL